MGSRSVSSVYAFLEAVYLTISGGDETWILFGISGSFNFTKSAEDYNAENLLVISNDPPLAEQYTASGERLLAQSHPFHPGKSHHKNGSHSRYYGPIGMGEPEPMG